MDKIGKVLEKMSVKERAQIKIILEALKKGSVSSFDVKKLKNQPDIFRIRKGRLRLIFRLKGKGEIMILAIERRSDNTYNNY